MNSYLAATFRTQYDNQEPGVFQLFGIRFVTNQRTGHVWDVHLYGSELDCLLSEVRGSRDLLTSVQLAIEKLPDSHAKNRELLLRTE